MTLGRLNIAIRRMHYWLSIAIGVQLGLWLVSGLFMTLFPIETVRGTHLQAEPIPNPLQKGELVIMPDEILEQLPTAQTLTLQRVDGQVVYIASIQNRTEILSAQTGEPIDPLSEEQARRLAQDRYSGKGHIVETTLFEDSPPREYGRAGPVWQVKFDEPDKASFYIDARTGEVMAVRTDLWRTFDFMWGLHIMDWSSRENFNSWWIKATAAVAALFFFSGISLVVLRLRAMVRRRRLASEAQ
ncbi:MAG: PepSY domain-containing protein [Pseudomonadota bacterium]